ncbi:MAG: CDP-alcohol phosphatidyltransferase family protein [Candidatus Kryptonium sp.]|nr:CDP-alcohol phosphatidyltransferase family protein [Candidatus Kryptonium sp.]MDW8108223.1 CDP-alcohol phosphatidyltransferase family protein [Candidatus Kryptonium sp.]
MSSNLIPKKVEKLYLNSIEKLLRFALHLNINPNFLTTVSFFVGILAGYFFAVGKFIIAGILTLLSGILDTLDGKIARMTNRVTKFGALYDSTLDRYTEVVIFFGIGVYLIKYSFYITSVAAVFAIGGSMMVSYIRARAEGLGFECDVGLMRRAERVVLLGFGSVFYFLHDYFIKFFDFAFEKFDLSFPAYPPMPLSIAIYIMAIFTNVTALQRLYYVWKKSKEIDLAEQQNELITQNKEVGK